MCNAMLAMLALLAAMGATLAGSGPAAAIDYPYCIQGRGWGIPGDCSYRTSRRESACMSSGSISRIFP